MWNNFILKQAEDCDDPKGFAQIMRSLYYLKYGHYPELSTKTGEK